MDYIKLLARVLLDYANEVDIDIAELFYTYNLSGEEIDKIYKILKEN